MDQGYGNDKIAAKKKRAKQMITVLGGLKSKRGTWETNWQETFDYCVPRKGTVTSTRTPGDKRGVELFDSTSIISTDLLSGALHGMLTNPASQFLEMTMLDPRDMEDEQVKDWCFETGELMFQALNNTNFQTEVHEIYLDLCSIGTASLYMGEHEENLLHFSARPIKEIYIRENNLGQVDTVYRVFMWSARQIIQEFGEKGMDEWVLEKNRKGDETELEIIHCVEPRDKSDSRAKMFPFASAYVLTEREVIIAEGGYKEFPFAVPRWTKVTGEEYGRGPGMQMMPDIKMVNAMMETTLKGGQLTVAPPFTVQDDGVIGRVRMTPLGLTVVRPGLDSPVKPLITDARVDYGMQLIDSVRKTIKTGFYGDLFTMNDGPQKTATETNMIAEQQMKLMGPILGRQHFEFLRPVATRLFGVMYRRGRLPKVPDKIKGKQWDVRYTSLIARAQRMGEGQNFLRALSVAAPILQMAPQAADIVDPDAALRYILNDVYGVPRKVERTAGEISKTRQARAKQMQQQMQQAQEQHQASVIGQAAPGIAQLQQAQAQQQKP
jgi:hypothetical protein